MKTPIADLSLLCHTHDETKCFIVSPTKKIDVDLKDGTVNPGRSKFI